MLALLCAAAALLRRRRRPRRTRRRPAPRRGGAPASSTHNTSRRAQPAHSRCCRPTCAYNHLPLSPFFTSSQALSSAKLSRSRASPRARASRRSAARRPSSPRSCPRTAPPPSAASAPPAPPAATPSARSSPLGLPSPAGPTGPSSGATRWRGWPRPCSAGAPPDTRRARRGGRRRAPGSPSRGSRLRRRSRPSRAARRGPPSRRERRGSRPLLAVCCQHLSCPPLIHRVVASSRMSSCAPLSGCFSAHSLLVPRSARPLGGGGAGGDAPAGGARGHGRAQRGPAPRLRGGEDDHGRISAAAAGAADVRGRGVQVRVRRGGVRRRQALKVTRRLRKRGCARLEGVREGGGEEKRRGVEHNPSAVLAVHAGLLERRRPRAGKRRFARPGRMTSRQEMRRRSGRAGQLLAVAALALVPTASCARWRAAAWRGPRRAWWRWAWRRRHRAGAGLRVVDLMPAAAARHSVVPALHLITTIWYISRSLT